MAGYPHVVEMGEHAMRGGYSLDGEFEFGLELILEGLDALKTESAMS